LPQPIDDLADAIRAITSAPQNDLGYSDLSLEGLTARLVVSVERKDEEGAADHRSSQK
jgi:hypothetical protein